MKNAERRKMLATFLVAGIGAIIADHLIKPGIKRRLGL